MYAPYPSHRGAVWVSYTLYTIYLQTTYSISAHTDSTCTACVCLCIYIYMHVLATIKISCAIRASHVLPIHYLHDTYIPTPIPQGSSALPIHIYTVYTCVYTITMYTMCRIHSQNPGTRRGWPCATYLLDLICFAYVLAKYYYLYTMYKIPL